MTPATTSNSVSPLPLLAAFLRAVLASSTFVSFPPACHGWIAHVATLSVVPRSFFLVVLAAARQASGTMLFEAYFLMVFLGSGLVSGPRQDIPPSPVAVPRRRDFSFIFSAMPLCSGPPASHGDDPAPQLWI